MQIERITEDEFFDGLNRRIIDLADEVAETAEKIRTNPDSSTYHMDSFIRPLQVMKTLQRIRDKARAFKQHEDETVVYVKKMASGEPPKYYYLPQSKYDESKLAETLDQLEQMQGADDDLRYIS